MTALVPLESGDPGRAVVWAAPVPELDRLTPIAPDIWWLRFRLPFSLDHINIWVVDDGQSWTLIDTGYGDEPTRAIWQSLLDGPLAAKPVGRILVTHFHPDHLGQAGWLCRTTGAPLLMSRIEWLTGRMTSLDTSEEFRAAGEAFDRRASLPPELIMRRRERGNAYRRGVTPVPARVELLADGDEITLAGTRWRVIVGRGHAPEQVTLHAPERRLLIAADQLLPRITPVVGIWPTTPDPDPLGDFIASLDRYAQIGADTLVLPSHERPYRGLPSRITNLRAHHEERLAHTLEFCREPVTTYQAMRSLFARELDIHQLGFALAETMAHLRALEHRGALTTSLEPDGSVLWQRA